MSSETTCSLQLAVSPRGAFFVDDRDVGAGGGLTRGVAARIRRAFGAGAAHGLLHLASKELGTEFPPSLAWGRRFGKAFLSALCSLPDETTSVAVVVADDIVDRLLGAVPPMLGAEYLTGDLVRRGWAEMGEVVDAELAEFAGTLHEYVHRRNPTWNALGRVTLHLAEQKQNPLLPFAFLATYAPEMQESGRLRHVPLGKAIEIYRGDREALLKLLRPVDAASKASPFVAELVESGRIYHPLAWTAEDAHGFLKAVPACERSGIAVRVPDWWKKKQPSRVTATAVVGGQKAAGLGVEALLDFDVALTLDGRRLTAAEKRELLRGKSGLRLIRGEWVEVDPDRLRAALSQLEAVAAGGVGEGLTFAQGMRLLAGASARDLADEDDDESGAAWTRVEAGAWLGMLLSDLRQPEGSRETDPGPLLHGALRPYQRSGVAWMWLLGHLGLGACLADDMGLGKTVQVISLLLLRRKHRIAGPDLLVVPASLLGNWRAELERFAPSLTVAVAHRSEMAAADLEDLVRNEIGDDVIVMTTYGTLARLEPLRTRSWGLVVLDEAQAIKNAGTRQSKTVKRLASRQRIALTGTPIENRLGDVWSLFDFLCPGLLGTAKEFTTFTKNLARGAGSGYAPLRRLLSPYILRRLKTDRDVAPDLPDKTEVNVYCGLTRTQAALYSDSVEELARTVTELDGMARRGAVLAFLMRLKQICNHPSQWLGDGEFASDESGKFARLTELCEPIASRQEKLLVFTQFREMTAPLAAHLATIFGRAGLVLHGQTPVKRRQTLVAEFQTDGGPPFFVLSLKAGGTGLNLTAASHVIHFDRWWNPAVENQATDRAFRIGQKRNVMVHKFVCRGTVEEKVDRMIAAKQDLARDVIASGGEAVLTEMSTEELIDLVSLDAGRAAVD